MTPLWVGCATFMPPVGSLKVATGYNQGQMDTKCMYVLTHVLDSLPATQYDSYRNVTMPAFHCIAVFSTT
jgi:hypothetical protein